MLISTCLGNAGNRAPICFGLAKATPRSMARPCNAVSIRWLPCATLRLCRSMGKGTADSRTDSCTGRLGYCTGFSRATETCFCISVQLQSPIFLRVVLTTMMCLAEVSNKDSEEQDIDETYFCSTAIRESLLV